MAWMSCVLDARVAQGARCVLSLRPRKPETQVPCCPRVPVKRIAQHIPQKFYEHLEHNQKIASCCRHPENHEIEAKKSSPNLKGPDIYIFHCTCGKRHTIFCVGVKYDYPLPEWK